MDNINGSYLHSTSNLECFSLLFNAMSEENISLTDRLLFGTNVFNQSGYQVFINLLSKKSSQKESFVHTFTNEDTIKTISQILVCLEKVNSKEFNFLKDQFYNNQTILSHLKGNDVVQQNIDKMFLLVKLENKLDLKFSNDSSQSNKPFKNKI